MKTRKSSASATPAELPVSLTYLADGGSELASLPSPFEFGPPPGRTVAQPSEGHRQSQHRWLRAIRNADHVPVALFTTQSRRDIFALGYRTTWYLLDSFGVLFIAFGTAVVWLLLRLQRSSAAQHAGETRHRFIGAQLQEAIVLIDAKTYEIVEANETVLRALHCSLEQLSNRSVQGIFPDITAAALAQTLRDGGRKVLESRSYGKSGGKLDTEVAITSMMLLGRYLLRLSARYQSSTGGRGARARRPRHAAATSAPRLVDQAAESAVFTQPVAASAEEGCGG